MHSKKTDGQQWSIRAEFTVSPHAPEVPSSLTNNPEDKSGIHLSYSWNTNENANPTEPTNYRPMRNTCRPVEYQKGNLVFTSTPPCRLLPPTPSRSNLEIQDSGYGSDLLSLNSLASENLRSPNNDANARKCRSTCSIILCNNPNPAMPDHSRCGRINSLRCQTPAVVQNTRPSANFYGCGDPWCHHINVEDELLTSNKPSRDVGSLAQPQATNTTFLPHQRADLAGYQTYKRDVSIQTSDSLQKCSAKNLGLSKKKKAKEFERANPKKNANRNYYGQSSSSARESGEKLQPSSSKNPNQDRSERSGHTSDSSKKSRTIHIDVYCTDTEIESSDSSENESTSTPQTVFESEKVHVTHEKARDSGLPFRLKRNSYGRKSNNTSYENDSDIDDESSIGYPSKIDSCSTINDFSSSISSIKSWKNYSLGSSINDYSSFDSFNRMCIPKRFNTQDAPLKKSSDELYACRTNTLQNYDKYLTKIRENPDGRDSNINTNLHDKTNEEVTNKSNEAQSSGITILKTIDKMQSPFGILSGRYTELMASRFGRVINIFNKPDRHMGPTRNPDCSCDHCRRYFKSD